MNEDGKETYEGNDKRNDQKYKRIKRGNRGIKKRNEDKKIMEDREESREESDDKTGKIA